MTDQITLTLTDTDIALGSFNVNVVDQRTPPKATGIPMLATFPPAVVGYPYVGHVAVLSPVPLEITAVGLPGWLAASPLHDYGYGVLTAEYTGVPTTADGVAP